jgi:hypothetical protein
MVLDHDPFAVPIERHTVSPARAGLKYIVPVDHSPAQLFRPQARGASSRCEAGGCSRRSALRDFALLRELLLERFRKPDGGELDPRLIRLLVAQRLFLVNGPRTHRRVVQQATREC